jgi:hypothetical protein
MLLIVAALLAQAPATAVPSTAQPATAQPVKVKKPKPQQNCQYIEVTGSRSKRRVCTDVSGSLDLGPGVHSGSYGNGDAPSSTPPGNI